MEEIATAKAPDQIMFHQVCGAVHIKSHLKQVIDVVYTALCLSQQNKASL